MQLQPLGMTKRKCNTSHFLRSHQRLHWRVHWHFPQADNLCIEDRSAGLSHVMPCHKFGSWAHLNALKYNQNMYVVQLMGVMFIMLSC